MLIKIKSFSLSLLILGMTGCGFHPRGVYKIPDNLKSINIQAANPHEPFLVEFKKSLARNKITVIQSDDTDTVTDVTTLELGVPEYKLETLAIKTDGRPRLVKLNFNLKYNLNGPRSIHRSRSFTTNTADINVSLRQQQVFKKELNQDAANELMRQLVSTNSQTTQPELLKSDKHPC